MGHYDYEREEMLPFVPETAARILDVGCDSGRFGKLLRARSPETVLWGIDPIPSSEPHAYDQRVTGSFPEDLPDHEPFDCIVFNDVLEHFPDPWTVLASARGLLRDDGVIVASIPNVRHHSALSPLLRAGEWTYADQGILDRTHLRFFTKSSMVELFRSSGYSVATIEPINVDTDGKLATLNRLLGGRLTDFLALQYALVATP